MQATNKNICLHLTLFYDCNKQTAIPLTFVSRCKQQTNKKGGTSQSQTHATQRFSGNNRQQQRVYFYILLLTSYLFHHPSKNSAVSYGAMWAYPRFDLRTFLLGVEYAQNESARGDHHGNIYWLMVNGSGFTVSAFRHHTSDIVQPLTINP